MDLQVFHSVNNYVAGILALLLNSILIYLASTTRKSGLRGYRRLIVIECVIELTYTILLNISQIQVQFSHGYLQFITTTAIRHWGIEWHYFSFAMFSFILGAVAMSLVMEFYYRYQMICKDKIMTNMQIVKLMLGALAIVIWNTSWGLYGIYQTMNGISPEEYEKLFENHTSWYENGRPMLSVSLYKETFGNTMFILGGNVVVIGGYSAVAYFGIVVYNYLKKYRKSMSEQTRRLQSSMNKVMLIQALILLIGSTLPISVSFMCNVFECDYELIGTYVVTSESWVCILKPATTIMFVNSFRKRLLQIVPGIQTGSAIMSSTG